VTANYPYYIGTTSNFFDPGYRANEIHRVLSQTGKLSAADMMALQTDTRDYLAAEIVPVLVSALSGAQLSAGEQKARDLLSTWDYRMEIDSPAATIWWNFWQSYLSTTFDPFWKLRNVKVARSEVSDALGQDLEAWTLGDQFNQAFSLSGNNAITTMRIAFYTATTALSTQLGSNPTTWTWGRVHQRVIQNLAQVTGLDYGPRPDRGDANTPLAAPDFPSSHGPSWRMVVDWGAGTFQAIYPGGQSENPASAWYDDRVDAWFNGKYAAMLTADTAAKAAGSNTWRLQP
jgi:penicillin amidase